MTPPPRVFSRNRWSVFQGTGIPSMYLAVKVLTASTYEKFLFIVSDRWPHALTVATNRFINSDTGSIHPFKLFVKYL